MSTVSDNGIIVIDSDWCIRVDEYNYTLCKTMMGKSGKSEGKKVYKSIGYYHSLTEALEAYGRQIVQSALSNGTMTLSDALSTIREMWERVESAIREAIPKYKVVECEY